MVTVLGGLYSIFTKVLPQVATKEVPRCIDVAKLIIFISNNGGKKPNLVKLFFPRS
jgi:hypothetical protein